MNKTKVKTSTGIDKNGKNWYGVVITVEDYSTDMIFIDKIHYLYLKDLEDKNSNTINVNQSKH